MANPATTRDRIARMEPNPYDPPKADQPPRSANILKRGIGLTTILLLTPLAIGIAGLCSCGAGIAFAAQTPFSDDVKLIGGCAIAFLTPIAVLIGMIWWASATYRASVLPTQKRRD